MLQAEAELQEYEQLGGDFDQIVQEYADLQVWRGIATLASGLVGTWNVLASPSDEALHELQVCCHQQAT